MLGSITILDTVELVSMDCTKPEDTEAGVGSTRGGEKPAPLPSVKVGMISTLEAKTGTEMDSRNGVGVASLFDDS